MNAEEKQALIADCEAEIEIINRRLGQWSPDTFSAAALKSQLLRQQMALAALTAQPVELGSPLLMMWGREQFLAYPAAAVKDAIRAAGYEVQE